MKKITPNKILSIVSSILIVASTIGLLLSISLGKIDSYSFNAKEKTMFGVDNDLCVVLENDDVYINDRLLFNDPDGVIAMDQHDKEYIAGTENRLLKKYDENGTLLLTSSEQLQNISKIICDEDSIFVMFTLNNSSSVARFDYNLELIPSSPTRKFTSSLVRDIYLNKDEQTLSIVDEYGDYTITDYTLQNDIYYSSLDIFPSNVIINKDAIYAVNSSSFIDKFDSEGNLLWEYTHKGSIYKIFESAQGVYFLDNESRSVHLVNNDGKSQFTYDSGVNTLLVTELGNKLFIADSSETLKAGVISSINMFGFYKFLKIFCIVVLAASVVLLIFSIFKTLGKKALEKTKHIGKELYKGRFCYLALLPILVLLIVFCYYPTVNSLKLAFFEYRPNSPDVFVGFDNFKYVLNSEYFTQGIFNLLKILGTDLLKSVIPTLFFAEIIASVVSKKFKYASRVLLYLPAILPGVTSLLIWKSGILGENGVLNEILVNLGFIRAGVNWLGNDATAIWSIIFIGFPWVGNYIILYGALMAIPKSYYDACKLDGCGFFRRVFTIDVPLLKPQLRYLLLTSFIGSFQDFQRIYLTTGGSNNTKTPMLGLYTYLSNQELGYASAVGLIMFVVLFVATILTFKVDTKEV